MSKDVTREKHNARERGAEKGRQAGQQPVTKKHPKETSRGQQTLKESEQVGGETCLSFSSREKHTRSVTYV